MLSTFHDSTEMLLALQPLNMGDAPDTDLSALDSANAFETFALGIDATGPQPNTALCAFESILPQAELGVGGNTSFRTALLLQDAFPSNPHESAGLLSPFGLDCHHAACPVYLPSLVSDPQQPSSAPVPVSDHERVFSTIPGGPNSDLGHLECLANGSLMLHGVNSHVLDLADAAVYPLPAAATRPMTRTRLPHSPPNRTQTQTQARTLTSNNPTRPENSAEPTARRKRKRPRLYIESDNQVFEGGEGLPTQACVGKDGATMPAWSPQSTPTPKLSSCSTGMP